MQTFRYLAMTQSGELVNGMISASTAKEVFARIEYLGLVPIETVAQDTKVAVAHIAAGFLGRPRAEDVTIFTRDLSLLLKAGARLDDALELLCSDDDIGRLRPIVSKLRVAVLAGESFAEAVGKYPSCFPPIYAALVQVGETSGKLGHLLDMLASERARTEALRRRITDALQYPAFVLLAASCVLAFFVLVVLPQFGAVLRDFGAKQDSLIVTVLGVSEWTRSNGLAILGVAGAAIFAAYAVLRRPVIRFRLLATLMRLPGPSSIFRAYQTAVFCRNLGILAGSQVPLTTTLRILVDIMSFSGDVPAWTTAADQVRHGAKLSDALSQSTVLPMMAIRMIRIGEETGQLPILAGRIAEFYEAKLQRSLDRLVAVIGPAAVIGISVVVGGLIVSIMTALLSITQLVS
ncbi:MULTISPECIES: type II secretion system F family protein [Bradyrhizobium]|uniref:General secretion pathway protein GspF n=3 Tax=Bradyrhizobium TaxID=374 RepID=A0A410VIG1_9BRAD|nr:MULTISPECIES: type II secretion system F family protein [Bradyrhizobium]MCG2628171.1 type II secretion system F family protein [Bradyrhizobium zhengyangense]MCG2643290.1 type II secretion system F family protein [Bradyrhizobium zhengyangense]MCG2670396.1 type II secretion system F family protein [Bradyrhizobium zhengyangense]MDN4985869.1 type II secretion system F family protein [Bradyrhizobium sp. WYCCWR 13022]MDN5002752.1 type II secretion system F family protein [Bradyrhizobium sp. WYCCW